MKRPLAYWAALEHARTSAADAAILNNVSANNGQLDAENARRIAGMYRVARSFRGVAGKGYGQIAEVVNAIPTGPGRSLAERVHGVIAATAAIERQGYSSNPSGVTKLYWFRCPENWYLYDRLAATAVGAGLSSISGMRGFFALLEHAGVHGLNAALAEQIARYGLQLRSERVIDKFLWLRGSPDLALAIREIERDADSVFERWKGLRQFADAVGTVLPDSVFDPMRGLA